MTTQNMAGTFRLGDRLVNRMGHGARPLALAWLLARAPDILLIPGTLRLDHLQDNLAAAGLDLPREMLAAPGARVAGEVV
ncbi:hypothetical protein P7L68_01225 (plasmid) [Tistrella mobilis]|jgi:aryl-alcohol dehydrogenase-like predicted oxidoreductase|uniref:aldo/keto reductase n=1 Tax=Tistrella mobilis TaxID=171437 RepID=UPI003556D667